MKPVAKHNKTSKTNKPQQQWKKKKQKQQQQQQQLKHHPVYNKRQKSRRHKKVRAYSEPDAADVGWSPAAASVGGDLAPSAGEDRFLPRSLREFMWLKRVADLTPKERRRYLKSRRRTNPEVGDVAGMRRPPAKQANLHRRPGESAHRHLARVERTAQQTLLSAKYADRFGVGDKQKKRQPNKNRQQKDKNKKKQTDADIPVGQSDEDLSKQKQQQQPESSKPGRKARKSLGSRPSRLEPVVSEPPKSLTRIKLPIKTVKTNQYLSSGITASAMADAKNSGNCFPLDRMLIT